MRCGRRWRKSTTAMLALAEGNRERPGALHKPHGLFWWVWPTGPMGQTGWDMLRQAFGGHAELSESRRRATFTNGAEIWVKSSDHEDGLRGAGLDGVALTECRDMRGRIWGEIIRPSVMERAGWALFESTPRGMNWFYALERDARARDDWDVFHFTSFDNPSIPREELEQTRRDMSERMFLQEIMAEYMKDGAYFQRPDEWATIEAPDMPEQHRDPILDNNGKETGEFTYHDIFGGLDWGKENDFTVIGIACRQCNRIVDWDRFNQIDWAFQRARIKQYHDKWSVREWLPERNSIGSPNIEALRDMDITIAIGPDNEYGWQMSAPNKADLIEGLHMGLLDGFRIPREWRDEFAAFEITTRPIGPAKFSAPEGIHDDCVIAAALVYRQLSYGLQVFM